MARKGGGGVGWAQGRRGESDAFKISFFPGKTQGDYLNGSVTD